MTDKRRHPRSPVRLEIEMAIPGGETRRAVTRDLSIGGLFVESAGEPLARGASLTITFLPSARHPGPYSMQARVQRQASGGFAVTFKDFSLDDLRFLETLMPPG